MLTTLISDFGILAQSSFSWTPMTYYIVAGLIQTVVILVGFRVMGVDPEHNSFIGALIAAAVINVAAFFLKDQGVVGAMISGLLLFGILAAVSSGEVLKAFFMGIILVASYGAIGMTVVPRTPLEIDDIGGFTQVVMTGGLEAEPIREEDSDKLMAPKK